MKYNKCGLTIEDQADLLIGKGLIASRNDLIEKLSRVSYFRLSGYWIPFKDKTTNRFVPNTTLNTIWRRYTFDRRLRVLVLDAIERIEVFVRSNLANKLAIASENKDPFAYAGLKHLLPCANENLLWSIRSKFIKDHQQNKTSDFVGHFDRNYGDVHASLPIWMAVEIMTFGTVEDLYKAVSPSIRREIADVLGIKDNVFASWLKTLRAVRNLVAHHGRLWNRVVRMKPQIPAKDPVWKNPVHVNPDRTFCVLTICKYLISRIAPQSQWQKRLEDLFSNYSDIDLADMGFPANWKECPIWK